MGLRATLCLRRPMVARGGFERGRPSLQASARHGRHAPRAVVEKRQSMGDSLPQHSCPQHGRPPARPGPPAFELVRRALSGLVKQAACPARQAVPLTATALAAIRLGGRWQRTADRPPVQDRPGGRRGRAASRSRSASGNLGRSGPTRSTAGSNTTSRIISPRSWRGPT